MSGKNESKRKKSGSRSGSSSSRTPRGEDERIALEMLRIPSPRLAGVKELSPTTPVNPPPLPTPPPPPASDLKRVAEAVESNAL